MTKDDSQIDAFDPEAQRIIRQVIEGKTAPAEGAARLSSYWSPQEIYRGSQEFVIQTRSDSLAQLDYAATELEHQGLPSEARRLAELNWIIVNKLGDRTLMVQCAATLAQLMTGDLTAVDQRLSLLEFAVPIVLTWDRPPIVKATMLAFLADAQFTKAEITAEARRANIKVCEQALSFGAPLSDWWVERLHFIAGTRYNDLAETAADLEASVTHLRNALDSCDPATSSSGYGSVLNNLGNSLRDLGDRTARPELLQEAIACYDKALPFRTSVMLRERTLGNEAAAEEILRRLREGASELSMPAAKQQDSTRHSEVVRLLHIGQEIMSQASADDRTPEERRRAAASRYLQAAAIMAKHSSHKLRAELFHHLAGLFVGSVDDDDLWTGLCFANSAQRLSAGLWSPEGEARLRYHRGLMLMKIGYPDVVAYLTPAEELLRQAVPVLQRAGFPGEFDAASQTLLTCSSLLASCGAPKAERRAIALHAENEARRVRDSQSGPKDELAEKYRSYLSAITRVAPAELRDTLGRLALAAFKSRANQIYDEYNHAEQLIALAGNHLYVGDLQGALEEIEAAEKYARQARYSAPSVWCDLASFFSSVPMAADAARCLRRAQELMPLAAGDSEAVLPGDSTGHWIAEYSLEDYQKEIDKAKATLAGARTEPAFDTAKTSAILAAGEPRRSQIENAIRELWHT